MNLKPVLIIINAIKALLTFIIIVCLFSNGAKSFVGSKNILFIALFEFLFAIIVMAFSFGIEVCLIIPVISVSFISMISSLFMMLYLNGFAYVGYLFLNGIQIVLLSIYFDKHKKIVKKEDEK